MNSNAFFCKLIFNVSDHWHNPYTNASIDWQPRLRPDELSDPDMDSLVAFGPQAVHAARTIVDEACGVCFGINQVCLRLNLTCDF